MKHIMLDLETLSTEPNAMITAIGAVVMDFEQGCLREAFEAQVDIESYSGVDGFHMSPSTVKWWLSQDKDAQRHMLSNTMSVDTALFQFMGWAHAITDYKPKELIVWGNGAEFDSPILRNALLRRFDSSDIWDFRNDRCYRTVKAVFPKIEVQTPPLVSHRALDDAKYQALYLLELHKHVGLWLP